MISRFLLELGLGKVTAWFVVPFFGEVVSGS